MVSQSYEIITTENMSQFNSIIKIILLPVNLLVKLTVIIKKHKCGGEKTMSAFSSRYTVCIVCLIMTTLNTKMCKQTQIHIG